MAFLLLLFLSAFTHSATATLSADYYRNSCPAFSQIIRDTVTNKQITTPTTAAATLRLFFHDCLPNGCDASILISSTPFNSAERDADINLSLPGDAFDVVVRAKTALELSCPNTVSCADILATATRDLLTMVGGPYYTVFLGRKDAKISRAAAIEGTLPRPSMSVSEIIGMFGSRGFSVQEMVALSGAHSIGFSHCKEFTSGIFNYSKSPPYDSHYNPRFALGLQRACADYQKNPTLSVFNDIMTPNKFDNMYFKNLQKGLGVLKSDGGFYSDSRTRPWVEKYAADERAFFEAFSRAMVKLGGYGVKVGNQGEIRRRCDAFN
ncbi:peroxidase 31-like [Cucurbita pepo subsp. pepo]|uniref:peroxidase 31-like n=1 Tax=Cucurbita pepo subsp. pepo TaxID=3664 RepID=UPI000C9D3A50|nr:peroxidase 31-like [Cucurbita pepo subsp. pepo]